MPHQSSSQTFRRRAIMWAFGAALAPLAGFLVPTLSEDAVANGDTRTLTIYHVHTRETTSSTFRVNGRYDAAALEKLNWALRDWRRDEPTKIDPRLFDVAWEVQREVGSTQPIQIMSAFRSPETNAMLRRRSRAVAEYSQHMLGKAMDVHLTDVSMARVREVAMRLQRGGVGYYPTSGTPFVHMDVGSVRYWPRMSRQELTRIFPDGKTVDLPSDGQPMPRYQEALAEIQARGGSAETVDDSGGGGKSLLAMLFGGGEDDPRAASVAAVAGPAAPARSPRGGGRVILAATRETQPATAVVEAEADKQVAAASSPATEPAPVAPAPVVEAAAVVPLPVARPRVLAENDATRASDAATIPIPMPRPADLNAASNIDVPVPPPRPAEFNAAAAAVQANAPVPPPRPAEFNAAAAATPSYAPVPPPRPSAVAGIAAAAPPVAPAPPPVAPALPRAAERAVVVAPASLPAPSIDKPVATGTVAAVSKFKQQLPVARPDAKPSVSKSDGKLTVVAVPSAHALARAALPNVITQGTDRPLPRNAALAFAEAPAIVAAQAADRRAAVPKRRRIVGHKPELVPARVDRSNFRTLTAAAPTERATTYAAQGVGSALTPMRAAARVNARATSVLASSEVVAHFCDRPYGDLKSGHFSGPAVKALTVADGFATLRTDSAAE